MSKTHIWDYQGTYKGHEWPNVVEELSFAWSDLEHAYANLLDADLTISAISKSKARMDQAMDRVVRAIERVKTNGQNLQA